MFKDINPDIKVNVYNIFYTPETAAQFDFSEYDFVVDAVDMVTAKLLLAQRAMEAGVPIVNYGIAIAHMHGILKRSLSPFPEIRKLLK